MAGSQRGTSADVAAGGGVRSTDELGTSGSHNSRGVEGEGVASGSAPRLRQVVLNLVANALDAIDDASRQVDRRPRLAGPQPAPSQTSVAPLVEVATVAVGRLEIRVKEFTDHIELEFHDTGCGMTSDVLRKIFDPFFTTKPTGQGTGLGLPICHRIVTEHGGRLAATSAGLGHGSTFRLSLPRIAESQQNAA